MELVLMFEWNIVYCTHTQPKLRKNLKKSEHHRTPCDGKSKKWAQVNCNVAYLGQVNCNGCIFIVKQVNKQ